MAEVYEIELPDGRIVEYEGDSPPDESIQRSILGASLPKYKAGRVHVELPNGAISPYENRDESVEFTKAKIGQQVNLGGIFGNVIKTSETEFVSPLMEQRNAEFRKEQEKSSRLGALVRSGILDIPSAAAFTGAFGATQGATEGLRSIPRIGPAIGVLAPLAAGTAAAIGTRLGVDKLLPEKESDSGIASLVSSERAARDLQDQPTASLAGSILSNAPFFGIGAIRQPLTREIAARAVPAVAGGAIQAGSELVGAPDGEILSDGAGARIGLATLGGALFNEPTRLGNAIMNRASVLAGGRDIDSMLSKATTKQTPKEANAAANEIALGQPTPNATPTQAAIEKTLGITGTASVKDIEVLKTLLPEDTVKSLAALRNVREKAANFMDQGPTIPAESTVLADRLKQSQTNYAGSEVSTQPKLDELIGTEVEFSGYTGKLIKDQDGNFVVLRGVTEKGSPNMVEVPGTGKDGTISASSVDVFPVIKKQPVLGRGIQDEIIPRSSLPASKLPEKPTAFPTGRVDPTNPPTWPPETTQSPPLPQEAPSQQKKVVKSAFDSYVDQDSPVRSTQPVVDQEVVGSSLDNPIPGYQYTAGFSKAPGGKALKDVIGLISTNIRTVSPRVFGDLMKYEFKLHDVKRNWASRTTPLGQIARKTLSKEDFDSFSLALHNRDVAAANAIADNYENAEEIKSAIKQAQDVIAEMHRVQTEAGREIPALEGYFPRRIADYDEFRKALGKEEIGAIDKAIKEARRVKESPLTDQEKEDIINGMIEFQRKGTGKPGYMKPRSIEKIDSDISKYYEPFDVALDSYVNRVSRDVVNREFFGKFNPTDSDPDSSIGGNLGRRISEEIDSGSLDSKGQKILLENLRARFKSEQQYDDAIVRIGNGLRKATSLAFLGDASSAIAQFSDVILNMARYGLLPTYKGYTKKGKIKTNDIIHTPDENLGEYSRGEQGSAFTKLVNRVLDVTIGKADRFNKNGSINAAWDSMHKAANNPKSKDFNRLDRKYATVYGDEWKNKMLPDIKEGVLSDEARLILFTELSEIQPISPSEFPKLYNDSPRSRLIYALKSYWLKQLDIVRREGYELMKSSNTFSEGVANLAAYALIVAGQGFAIDATRDMIMGRETNPEDYVLSNLMRMVGLSRYQLYKAKEEGPAAAAFATAFPFGDVIKDAAIDYRAVASGDAQGIEDIESVKYLPFAGRLLYWNYGKGAQKTEKRRLESLEGEEQLTTLQAVKDLVAPDGKRN